MDLQAGRHWFARSDNRFHANIDCAAQLRAVFEAMTAELVDYRLAQYTQKRIDLRLAKDGATFAAKVSHSSGKPILRIPEVEFCPQRPMGPTTETLPDGIEWVFKFVKVACMSGTEIAERFLRYFFGNYPKQLALRLVGDYHQKGAFLV